MAAALPRYLHSLVFLSAIASHLIASFVDISFNHQRSAMRSGQELPIAEPRWLRSRQGGLASAGRVTA
jgi:hypothetical protein